MPRRLDYLKAANGGCGPTRSGGRSPVMRRRCFRPCSFWRPGSLVIAQCKLGLPGCCRWRESRTRQQPGVRRACVRRTRAKLM